MAGTARRTDGIGQRALRFLAAHALEPTPEHYAFAHRYLSGRDRGFSDAVDHHIEGGVRLREEAMRSLVPEGSSPGADASAALDRLTAQLMDVVGEATEIAGELNRDLVRTAAALVSSDPPVLREAVGWLVERTARAEAALSASLGRAQALRDRLSGMRGETGMDPLTGLPGRDAMAGRLASSLSATGGCAVALVAIDQLAALVEEYGDGIRDRVVRAVSLTLREACVPHEVGRWDEALFVVLVDGADAEAGAAVVEAARADMAARTLRSRENDEPIGVVTLSAGVVASRGRDRGRIEAAARRLLRQASAKGGNRIVGEPRLVDVAAG